jgi:hypothetical protein
MERYIAFHAVTSPANRTIEFGDFVRVEESIIAIRSHTMRQLLHLSFKEVVE